MPGVRRTMVLGVALARGSSERTSASAYCPSVARAIAPDDFPVDIVGQTLAGNRDAETALLQQLTPIIRRFLRGVCKATEREDALQESLMAIRSALPGFRGDGPVPHFAIRVARNIAVSRLRHELRQARHLVEVAQLELPLATGPSHPYEDVLKAQTYAGLHSLLGDLPRNQWVTVVFRVFGELSLAEVAKMTGVTTNTARTRLRLAFRALRERAKSNPELMEYLRG